MSGLDVIRVAVPPVSVSVTSEVSKMPVPLLLVKAGSSKVTTRLLFWFSGVMDTMIGPERSFR